MIWNRFSNSSEMVRNSSSFCRCNHELKYLPFSVFATEIVSQELLIEQSKQSVFKWSSLIIGSTFSRDVCSHICKKWGIYPTRNHVVESISINIAMICHYLLKIKKSWRRWDGAIDEFFKIVSNNKALYLLT